VRFANVEEMSEYRGAKSIGSVMRVGQREAFEETIFLGLRMCVGVSLADLRESVPREFVQPCEESADELIADGLMTVEDGCWRLTLRGRLVSNEVFGLLLESVTA